MAIPLDLPQLAVWLKADAAFPGHTEGQVITQWVASDTTGVTVTQGATARRPTYRTGVINGLPAVEFDGVDDTLPLGAAHLPFTRNIGSLTAVVVYRAPMSEVAASSAIQQLVHVNRAGSSLQARFAVSRFTDDPGTNSGTYRVGGRRLDTDAQAALAAPNGISTAGEANIVTGTVDYATSDARLFQNGTQVAESLAFLTDGLTSDTASTAGMIGGRSDAGGEFFRGHIAELLCFRGTLTAAERAKVHSYLADKYAIAVSDYDPAWAGAPVATTGTGAGTTAPATAAGAAATGTTGAGAGTTTGPTGTGAAATGTTGAGAGTTTPPTGTGAAATGTAGTAGGTTAAPAGTGAAAVGTAGAGTGTTPVPAGTATGAATATGTSAGTTPPPAAAGEATTTAPAGGTGAGITSPATGAGAAAAGATGTGAAAVPPALAAGGATASATGSGDATTAPPSAAAEGGSTTTGAGAGTTTPSTGSGAGGLVVAGVVEDLVLVAAVQPSPWHTELEPSTWLAAVQASPWTATVEAP